MKLLAVTLCCLQLCHLAWTVSEDEQLFGWQEFELTVNDEPAATSVRQYANAMDFLIASENTMGYLEIVVVPPSQVVGFATFLSNVGVKFNILQKDVGGTLLKVKLDNMLSARAFNNDPATYFAPTSEIYSWMEGLASANPYVTLNEIGTSYEGRRMLVLELSSNRAASKPVIFIDAAIHAREWLAPATLNFIIRELISDYSAGNAEARQLMDKFDWHFMPVLNPDGYDYTFRSSSTRFWRKTRKPYGLYYGADPNRNFDYMFGGAGTSNNPSSDVYHGPNAFSEPETKALSVYLTGIKSRLQRGMYISFHTYGQYWLTPPGFTRANPEDHDEMVRIGNIGRDAIQSAGGPAFRVGKPANVGLYEAAGGSYDWVKYRAGVRYSFTLELRPGSGSGLTGFAPSSSVIPSSGKEIYSAVKAVAGAI